jgi:ssDNA-binding Zn-finger/Zn-ribbon topoisomerase 1
MAKMKKKQQNEKLYCPYCGGLAVLRPAEYVYGERNLNPDNYLYVCSGYPSCDSYIGVHKKSMRPMGTLANGDLRHKRIEAHRSGYGGQELCIRYHLSGSSNCYLHYHGGSDSQEM